MGCLRLPGVFYVSHMLIFRFSHMVTTWIFSALSSIDFLPFDTAIFVKQTMYILFANSKYRIDHQICEVYLISKLNNSAQFYRWHHKVLFVCISVCSMLPCILYELRSSQVHMNMIGNVSSQTKQWGLLRDPVYFLIAREYYGSCSYELERIQSILYCSHAYKQPLEQKVCCYLLKVYQMISIFVMTYEYICFFLSLTKMLASLLESC